MGKVVVSVVMDAAPARVWRALTDPAEVEAWDGSVPVDVPSDYPRVGERALWRSHFGPFPIPLHDQVLAVVHERRLAATITFGIVRIEEEYRLGPGREGGSVLVSDNTVTSRVPGLDRLATALVRRSARSAMAALARHCAA